MKTFLLIMLLAAVFGAQNVTAAGQQDAAEEAPGIEDSAAADAEAMVPDTLMERFSYAFGYLSAMSFVQQGIELDGDFFSQAVLDVYADAEPVMSIEEMNQALEEYQRELQTQAQAFEDDVAALNLEEAEAFLADNAQREEVFVTESGLQYEVLEQGDGPSPTADDVVVVHYIGMFMDGAEFDSSHDYGQPVSFPLTGVIPSWTEGLQLMNVGSTYMFYVHPDLGYGRQGRPPQIGPNELLTFEIELIEIE